MPSVMRTAGLTLVPAKPGDVDSFCALLWQPEVRRYLCDDALIPRADVVGWIEASREAASSSALWRIASGDCDCAGLVELRPPSAASLKLRAIGWRSRELGIALDPSLWGRRLAREAVEAVADYSRQDPVTFALVGAVDVRDERSRRLMERCGFHELGRVGGPRLPLIVYELPL